jgi:AraC-like DNA-binding protein
MTLTKIEPFLPTNLAQTGSGLNRPECVLAARDGSLYTGDWTLGIARIAPDGTTGPAVEADLIAQGFRPNGIALRADGDFLFANLSKKAGGVGMSRSGFAARFGQLVGDGPIEYLTRWRMLLAGRSLSRGEPIGVTARSLGANPLYR